MGADLVTSSEFDPFKTKVRRYIPPDDYWRMVDAAQQASLCDRSLASVDAATVRARIAQLEEGERRDGFVFEGELQWLQDYFAASPKAFTDYGDWVRWTLDHQFFEKPLAWGIYEDGNGYTSPDYRDIWCGRIESKHVRLPRLICNELQEPYEYWISGAHKFAVTGSRHGGPSKPHLRKLFEALHNLPYYVAMRPDSFVIDCAVSFTGVDVIHTTRDRAWTIEMTSEYSAIWGFGFDDRRPIGEDHDCHDREMDFGREIRDDKRSGALLMHVTIGCPLCAHEQPVDLKFHWGSDTDTPTYEIGDEIRWSPPRVGFPRHPTVYVAGKAQSDCTRCGMKIETLIRIQDNRIERLAPEKHKQITYLFQSPWVSDKLIPWKDCEEAWAETFVREKTNAENCFGFALLQRAFLLDKPSQHGLWRHAVKKWLIHRNRDLWTEEEYLRLMEQLCMSFLGMTYFGIDRTEEPVKATPLKSCAVLRNAPIGKETVDVWFAWGSLLDFPEYRLGDSVVWSDYALGESGLDEVKAIGKLIASSNKKFEPGRLVEIRIQRDQIVEACWSSIKTFGGQPHRYQAYVNGEPYLHWPDEKFLF
jgi:hypothetical protein